MNQQSTSPFKAYAPPSIDIFDVNIKSVICYSTLENMQDGDKWDWDE